MDVDQWLKVAPIVSTIVFGGSTLWFAIKQNLDGNKNSRREEYKFAKLFFDELNAKPEMHPFARKKGFQAIGRNQDLPPSVIEHLMTLRDPVAALSDYESSRGYLKNTEVLGKAKLNFASNLFFATETRRNWISRTYAACAIIFYLFAFTPWILLTLGKIPVSLAVNASVAFSPIGLAVSIGAAREFLQLRRAMRLVKMQNQQIRDDEVAVDDQD